MRKKGSGAMPIDNTRSRTRYEQPTSELRYIIDACLQVQCDSASQSPLIQCTSLTVLIPQAGKAITASSRHIIIMTYYNACCASKQTLQQAHMPCICLGANVAMNDLQCKNCRATIAMQKLSCTDCHARIAARELPLLHHLLRHMAASDNAFQQISGSQSRMHGQYANNNFTRTDQTESR